jgi:hypothetical protein
MRPWYEQTIFSSLQRHYRHENIVIENHARFNYARLGKVMRDATRTEIRAGGLTEAFSFVLDLLTTVGRTH